jgi:2-isopropylmalate synthase
MAKYQEIPVIALSEREWPGRRIERAPIFCSVDLRDGNQALVNPMGVAQKKAFFKLLLDVGFREIEIGFPSASQIEFDFARMLIDGGLVPAGVSLQVLCQTRKHLVDRTVESLKGARKVIFHLYTSTSPAHRKYTFGMGKDEVKAMAVDGVKMLRDAMGALRGTELDFEFSPESFSVTESEYALEVCEAVMDEWKPDPGHRIILNLPATVESFTPNLHADQIEWFRKHLSRPDSCIISLHNHNDRGTGVAACELGLLAGAQRVEGTLFGNGERTGNLDIVTLALNMMSQGIGTGLDFSDLPALVDAFEDLTGMQVPQRHPYAGELVFTAFSGSHQDAIKKALDARSASGDKEATWDVPYLLVDPQDLGRSYEAIIRINSQSGKGGVAWVLRSERGYDLPRDMRAEVGTLINAEADKRGVEIPSEDVIRLFETEFVDRSDPVGFLGFKETGVNPEGGSRWELRVRIGGKERSLSGSGKGPIDAAVQALETAGYKVRIRSFHEESLGSGSDAKAVAYLALENGKVVWGAGVDADIAKAGVRGLLCALNRSLAAAKA